MEINFLTNKNVDLQTICRVCLTTKKDMQQLFGAEKVAEMLVDFAQIKLQKLDGWPDKICIQCVHQVSRCHAFKQRVEKTDSTLREYIKGLTVVIEPIPDPLKGVTIQYELPRQQKSMPVQPQHQIQAQTIQTQPQIILTNATPQLSQIAQLINAGQLQIATANPTSHLIQNGHILQGAQIIQGQQIQMITQPNGQTQIVQLQTRNTEDGRCEILMQPDMQDTTQYYEEVIIANNHQEMNEMQQLQIETIDDSEEEPEMADSKIIIMQQDALTPLQQSQQQHQIIIQEQMSEGGGDVEPTKDEIVEQEQEQEESDTDEKQFLAEYMSQQTTQQTVNGLFVCNLCHKEFKNIKWLQSHMKCHSNWIKAHCKKQPECEICHKSFRGPGMLKMHMKTHEREDKMPTCSICNKEFKSKSILYRHRQTHFERKKLSCTVCSKEFGTQYQLNAHMSRHQGIKNYKCVHCEKSFYLPSDLKNHMQLHLGIKSPKKYGGKSTAKE